MDEKQLKKEVKLQDKSSKKIVKEIKGLSKKANPQVEADFIDLSKKINKRYKQQGLQGHKANNEYILLLEKDILKTLTSALTKRERFNMAEYKSLIEELKDCLDTRDVISISSTAGEEVALEALCKAYTEKLRRLETKRQELYIKYKAKDAELKANPNSAALDSECQQIFDNIKRIDNTIEDIKEIVRNNNLETYIKSIQMDKKVLEGAHNPDGELYKIDKEILEGERDRLRDENLEKSKSTRSERDSYFGEESKKEVKEEKKEETEESNVDRIKNMY